MGRKRTFILAVFISSSAIFLMSLWSAELKSSVTDNWPSKIHSSRRHEVDWLTSRPERSRDRDVADTLANDRKLVQTGHGQLRKQHNRNIVDYRRNLTNSIASARPTPSTEKTASVTNQVPLWIQQSLDLGKNGSKRRKAHRKMQNPPALRDSADQKPSQDPLAGDDLIRNCITGDVIGRMPANIRTETLSQSSEWAVRESPEDGTKRKMSFNSIYFNKTWGHSWDELSSDRHVSGRGATLTWTQEAIAGLHHIITRLKASLGKRKIRLLDAPCGDMAWMSRFLETRDDVIYFGVDIVPELIERHKKTYAGRGWTFTCLDVVDDPIPGDFDLVVSRTLLQHLYNADVLRVLAKFSDGGSRYLFATTFSGQLYNAELYSESNPGRFRELNLEIPPISLAPPLCLQRDGPPYDFEGWKHFLGLWRLPLMQIVDCDKVRHFKMMNTQQDIYSCVEWSPYIDLSLF